MRVLVAWPPHVPSYFNAGHHLPVFSAAAYLRARGHDVDAWDAGALNVHWKAFGARLAQGKYDAVILINEFDVVEGVRRAADYARALLPGAVIVTAGRLSYQVSGFFRRLPLDAIVVSGDPEAGVAAVLDWAASGRPNRALPGVVLRDAEGWREPAGPGVALAAEDWALPDVAEIPYAAYEALYADDRDKFCGIPSRRELVVPVARGCPVNCAFCDVPKMQGRNERRLPVDRVIAYIQAARAAHPFEYVAFYAPTFTLNRRWIVELCEAMAAHDMAMPWKCATTLHHLDEALVGLMARAQCRRISVGVETFETADSGQMPKLKQISHDRFSEVAGWCRAHGVELNCFVIVGLPGTTAAGARATIAAIKAEGARPRPTMYTPYHLMRDHMSEASLSAFNRHLLVEADLAEAQSAGDLDLTDILFLPDGYITQSHERIPLRRAR
jgi:radical SAM superfamily enzyme YgiQ (UPF0313 family)